ncbi:MAG: hypothetical protein GY820_34775 [Gammaproteobacteria bacterium]|nr:hypothetical protein [Gammaproteobacteria bacterium]
MGSVIITIIYAELQNAWESTAEFVALMLKLWNVTNVKTTTSGERKRDLTKNPVSSSRPVIHNAVITFLSCSDWSTVVILATFCCTTVDQSKHKLETVIVYSTTNNFLQLWKEYGKRRLTTETFLATRHTCNALADAAEFCLNAWG